MTYQLDGTDRRILHELMIDARNASASEIAEELDVSAGTVRYRIDRLEEEGIIRRYTTVIDFEQIGRLASVFMCTVPADSREESAVAAWSIPGVMSVRVLMAGQHDLQIVAVGETTTDLREIARSLAEFEIDIQSEKLLQTEIRGSYEQFPTEDPDDSRLNEVAVLTDGTPVLEGRVAEDASIAGLTLDTAKRREVIPSNAVIVLIERDGRILRPTAERAIETGDVVTIIAHDGSERKLADAFTAGPDPIDRTSTS